ncbi:MAG TPA: response regulator [Solirubrobacteraceae bacterium]
MTTRQHAVLVVDDEETIAEVVARYLDRAGYATSIAHDGAQALASAERARPDLVVLDLMLPRVGGLEVMAGCARRATTRPRCAAPPRRRMKARRRSGPGTC